MAATGEKDVGPFGTSKRRAQHGKINSGKDIRRPSDPRELEID